MMKCRDHGQRRDLGGSGDAEKDPAPDHNRNEKRPEGSNGGFSDLMQREFLLHR